MNMTTKISNAFFLILMLAGTTACNSTRHPVEESVAVAPPPPELEFALPLEEPMPIPPEPPARICQLGTSCLAMDPRPFEPCLLTTRHCADKATPMLVRPPDGPPLAPQKASR
jgi:hypothetical protein